jgi:hypothetical protein
MKHIFKLYFGKSMIMIITIMGRLIIIVPIYITDIY